MSKDHPLPPAGLCFGKCIISSIRFADSQADTPLMPDFLKLAILGSSPEIPNLCCFARYIDFFVF